MPLTFARAGRVGGVTVAAVSALVIPSAAAASELVTRDARSPRIQVNSRGIALVTYVKAGGGKAHVLYWGAIGRDKRFKHDRSGGWASGKANWRRFSNTCGPYEGPPLFAVVDACTARDGSHWALQAWNRIRPIGALDGPRELRISHWRGDTAELWAKSDWSWRGRSRHLYGQLTFQGRPVFGAGSRTGYVTDGVGRNIALQALDSDYGPGWRYVNGFLTNKPSGQFCYGLNRKRTAGGQTRTGVSRSHRYRVLVAGPYVSPDVMHEFTQDPGGYDRSVDAVANREQLRLLRGVRAGSCWPVN